MQCANRTRTYPNLSAIPHRSNLKSVLICVNPCLKKTLAKENPPLIFLHSGMQMALAGIINNLIEGHGLPTSGICE